jgi:hypothetical protein
MLDMSDPYHTHYAYRVLWSPEDDEFVGLCTEFPSLSWLAPTQDEALEGIRDLVRDTIKDIAHDVLHRDIKPANVLLAAPDAAARNGDLLAKITSDLVAVTAPSADIQASGKTKLQNVFDRLHRQS